jgi:hypothetical protein
LRSRGSRHLDDEPGDDDVIVVDDDESPERGTRPRPNTRYCLHDRKRLSRKDDHGTYIFRSSNGGRKDVDAGSIAEAVAQLGGQVADPGDWRLDYSIDREPQVGLVTFADGSRYAGPSA